MSEESGRRVAWISVHRSKLRGGEEVVSIFGLPSRVDRSEWGPEVRALWDRVIAEGRTHGSTTLDLDEWDAAHEADRDAEPGTEREHPC